MAALRTEFERQAEDPSDYVDFNYPDGRATLDGHFDMDAVVDAIMTTVLTTDTSSGGGEARQETNG